MQLFSKFINSSAFINVSSRSLLEIREDLQPDEEWTRKGCFSDAGADELLRAVREAAAKEVQRVIGEESCEANAKESLWRPNAEQSGTRARRRRAEMFGPLG